jgi:hypothetical protein
MSRYVMVPDDVTLVHPLTGEADGRPTTFSAFVTKTIMGDPRWTVDLQSIEAAHDIMVALREASPGKAMALEKDDWERLKACAEKPAPGVYAGYHGSVIGQFRGFIRAILDAKETPPT